MAANARELSDSFCGLQAGICEQAQVFASTAEDSSFTDLCQRACQEIEEELKSLPCQFLPLPIATAFLGKLMHLYEANKEIEIENVPRPLVVFTLLIAKTSMLGLEVIQSIASLPFALCYSAIATSFQYAETVSEEGPFDHDDLMEFLSHFPLHYTAHFYQLTMGQLMDSPYGLSVFDRMGHTLNQYFRSDAPFADYRFSPIPTGIDLVKEMEATAIIGRYNRHNVPISFILLTLNTCRLTLHALALIQGIATLPIACLYSAGCMITDITTASIEEGEFPSQDHLAEYVSTNAVGYFNLFYENTLNIEDIIPNN
ncbi:MAG: hypothetical protein S4CHLAM102_00580 [Chlamydiia bacterium]|nr:hypothetical protein [Chlamydiia bacterium]